MRKFVMEEGWVPKKLGNFLFTNAHALFRPWFSTIWSCLEFLWIENSAMSPDVYIDVPDVIDITNMRSKGLQSGEELLPDTGLDF